MRGSRAVEAKRLLAGRTSREPSPMVDINSKSRADGVSHWSWIYAENFRAPELNSDGSGPPNENHAFEEHSDQSQSSNRHPSRKRKRTAHAWLPSDDRPSSRSIVGAHLGAFTVRLGDVVTLRADRNDVWVAIVTDFVDAAGFTGSDSESDEEDERKRARFMWLSSPKDIHNKSKRLRDALPNERYITTSTDINPLEAITGNAVVMSPQRFHDRWPTGKIPRSDPNHGRVFVCRRGVNLRTATYTDDFTWEVMYSSLQDLEKLQHKVESETKSTRKILAKSDDLDDFVVPDEEDYNENRDANPRTPRKNRKLIDGETYVPMKRTPHKEKLSSATTSVFETPTHRRIMEKKPLEFTPLGTRILSPSQHSALSTPHARAKTSLHVSTVPTSLPCREQEFQTVYNHLEGAITSGLGTTIYISGTPGTGKTATVREVVASLSEAMDREELDDFIFVEINGMKVTDPVQSYSLLWEALTSQRVAASQALGLLNQEFSRPSPRRVPCVVLMDELDQLATRNNAVMYNFFNWPGLRHSRLIVLAVANTMDLPERTLSNKISSRLGLTRVTFAGYGHAQLMRIIEARLEGVKGRSGDVIVESDAIQFAARKVAQVSGDARRCLDVCRRAVEIAELEAKAKTHEGAQCLDGENKENLPETPSKTGRGKKTRIIETDARPVDKKGRVTIAVIQRAIREATSSPLQQYLRTVPLASKLFLAALLACNRRAGVAEASLGDVLDEGKKIASMSELQSLREWLLFHHSVKMDEKVNPVVVEEKRHIPRVLGIAATATELLEAGVIVAEDRRGNRGPKVRLNVGDEEVKSAMKDDVEARGLGFTS